MIINRAEFDLASLRTSCAPFFRRWDAAVAEGEGVAAMAERRALLAHARLGLSVDAASAGGVYFFYRPSTSVEIHDIAYIGIADGPARPMRVRIEDRLRDDNCFDASLDELTRLEAVNVVSNRLQVAMPKSSRDYTAQHLRTCDLMRASGRILLNAVQAAPFVIREAEKVLIATAWTLSVQLRNKQHRNFRGRISTEAADLAKELIGGLPQHAFSQASANCWLDQLKLHQQGATVAI